MRRVRKVGAEEARNQLPDLLKAAENGTTTIITKHGRPVAALIPIEQLETGNSQRSILPLKGSGRGMWGKNSSQTLRALRDEWNR
jgi:prevent-host-death family protein